MLRVAASTLSGLLCFLFIPAGYASDFQGATHLVPIDGEGINYTKSEPQNAIQTLQDKLEKGEVQLAWDAQFGYLPAVLKSLEIPFSSQALVFSRTSMQRDHISPRNPRALFFNDDVYIGWIPGAPLMEVSVADPGLGGVFYTLEDKPIKRPSFKRNDQCLECHASSKSLGVPGHLIRSFATDTDGVVDLSTGTSQVTHRTPFPDRWGGWYVTGTHGDQVHRGNLMGKEAFQQAEREPNYAGNCTNLGGYFSTSKYVSGQSDIVALMVLEHQVHMHNYITRLKYEATTALKTYGHVKYLRTVVESFLQYMLFVDESPLTDPVQGTTDFKREFEALGPKDSKDRSLRQFDLRTRLFKFPCSYLIYSEAFDALPGPVLDKIYRRFYEILTSQESDEKYEVLTSADRQNILAILRETKAGLPDYWQEEPPTSSE